MKTCKASRVCTKTALFQQWLSVFLVLGFSAIFLLAGPMVFAHGSWTCDVPRRTATEPVPTVDGQRGSNEYYGAWWFMIPYRPRSDFDDLRVYMVSTDWDLYVFIEGMPEGGMWNRWDYVALIFDTAHDGGRVPRSDDIQFEVGHRFVGNQALRGDNTSGFVPDYTITGWEAVKGSPDSYHWNVELRIPLSLIGGGDPGSRVGFSVGHYELMETEGNDYRRPPTASETNPLSWGDLAWEAASPVSIPCVDVIRITQGLELQGNTAYDFIAGKDTLLRTQLYIVGPYRPIVEAVCEVQRIAPLPEGTAQTISVLRTLPGPSAGPGKARRKRARFFNGSPTFDFWIPGSMVASPGQYRIRLRTRFEGDKNFYGIYALYRTFQATRDLNLLLVPNDERPYIPNARAWGSDLTAAIPNAMRETQRLMPLRAGSTQFYYGMQSEVGLHYMAHPTVFLSQPGSTWEVQDSRRRTYATNLMHEINRQLAARDPSRQLGRLDLHYIMGASTRTLGGQAQSGFSPPSAAGGFDPNPTGGTPTVLMHEVAHCLGQVRAGSPNKDPGAHSSHSAIYPPNGLRVVNMLTRADVTRPGSVMYRLVGEVPFEFPEAYEWNDLRRSLVALPVRPSPPPVRPQAGTPRFHLSGAIDKADQIVVDFSERVEDPPMELTPTDPTSPYKLVFLSSTATQLASYPFKVSFDTVCDYQPAMPVTHTGIFLTTPLPAGSARVEIRKNTTVLWSQVFSAQPPALSNVVAGAGQGVINLQWNCSDPDSTAVIYNVFFRANQGAISFLLATGLTDPSFTFPTDLAPATTDGRLIVRASDGLNVKEVISNPFTIAPRPPVASITHPTPASIIVAGQPLFLVGGAWDFTSGALTGSSLAWSSDIDGPLGTGEQLEVSLTAGNHVLTLTATGYASLTDTTSVAVTALADTDNDGLPDSYELQHPGLSPTVFDSDEDPDGDLLTSYDEWRLGTNPFQSDSDLDGFLDGDEVRLGSDPLNAQSTPLPDLVFVREDAVDLGNAPPAAIRVLDVMTSPTTVKWTVGSDSPWLVVLGGGTGDGQILITANCSGLAYGQHSGLAMVVPENGQTRWIEVSITMVAPTAVRPSWRFYR